MLNNKKVIFFVVVCLIVMGIILFRSIKRYSKQGSDDNTVILSGSVDSTVHEASYGKSHIKNLPNTRNINLVEKKSKEFDFRPFGGNEAERIQWLEWAHRTIREVDAEQFVLTGFWEYEEPYVRSVLIKKIIDMILDEALIIKDVKRWIDLSVRFFDEDEKKDPIVTDSLGRFFATLNGQAMLDGVELQNMIKDIADKRLDCNVCLGVLVQGINDQEYLVNLRKQPNLGEIYDVIGSQLAAIGSPSTLQAIITDTGSSDRVKVDAVYSISHSIRNKEEAVLYQKFLKETTKISGSEIAFFQGIAANKSKMHGKVEYILSEFEKDFDSTSSNGHPSAGVIELFLSGDNDQKNFLAKQFSKYIEKMVTLGEKEKQILETSTEFLMTCSHSRRCPQDIASSSFIKELLNKQINVKKRFGLSIGLEEKLYKQAFSE